MRDLNVSEKVYKDDKNKLDTTTRHFHRAKVLLLDQQKNNLVDVGEIP